MKCPVCSNKMVEEDFGGVHVDVCKNGCKGIWFDWFELLKLDEHNEGLGKALFRALKYPRVNDKNRKKLRCPKCNIPMHAHKYQHSKEVNVDECYKCGGFFLDSGELRDIRDSYMNESERKKYADKLAKDIPAYTKMKEENAKLRVREQAIRKYTRFMRISYLVTKR